MGHLPEVALSGYRIALRNPCLSSHLRNQSGDSLRVFAFEIHLHDKAEALPGGVDQRHVSHDGSIVAHSPEPLSGSFGKATLVIEHLRWDDLVVHHDAQEPATGLADWFEKWFDPDKKRYAEGTVFGNIIHSLSVQRCIATVDLGSAEPEAFWDLLDLLEAAGARNLHVTASRLEEA